MYRIPPSWDKVKPRIGDVGAVIVRGTSFREPECEHDWCTLKGAKQWKGPVEEGIFHDSTLQEMCARVPQSLPEFAQLSGVGERKLDKYGAVFLSAINNHLAA